MKSNNGTVEISILDLQLFSSFEELKNILVGKNLISNGSKITNTVIFYRLDYSDAQMKIDWIEQ